MRDNNGRPRPKNKPTKKKLGGAQESNHAPECDPGRGREEGVEESRSGPGPGLGGLNH